MRQFTWDFVESLGDTIKEKYETLYAFVQGVEEEMGKIRFVVTSPEIASIFETATAGFTPTDNYVEMSDFAYCGRMFTGSKKALGFRLYKAPQAAIDEMVLFAEKGNAVIKIDRFVC